MEIKSKIILYILISLSFQNCKTKKTENIKIDRNDYVANYVKIEKFNPEIDSYYLESSKINFFHLFFKYDTYKVEIDKNNIKTFKDTIALINEIISLKNNNKLYYRLVVDYYPLPNKHSSYISDAPTKVDLIPLNLIFLYLLENYLNPIHSKKERMIPILTNNSSLNYNNNIFISQGYKSLYIYKQKSKREKKIIDKSILHFTNLDFKKISLPHDSIVW